MTPAQAAAKVWALVSGFPPEKARQRYFLVLQCYVDGSGTGSPDLFVMAGYLAPAEKWAAFSKEWQERLDMRPPLPYFKMNEMAQSPERMERAGWFYRVIEQHVSAAVSCVIHVPELIKAVRETRWPKGVTASHLENPYFMGFHSMVAGVAHEQTGWGLTEKVDFIFDQETVRKFPADYWERMKAGASSEARKMMGDHPIYRDDRDTLPIQAADLWAWWIRKWALEGTTDGIEHLKLPWPIQRPKLFRYHAQMREADFRDLFDRMLSPKNLAIALNPNAKEILRAIEAKEAGVRMTIPDPSSGWGRSS